MSLRRGDTLSKIEAGRLQEFPLTPEDFFLLSRIEDAGTVAEAIVASGLDPGAAEAILERLIAMGALIPSIGHTKLPQDRTGRSENLRHRSVAEAKGSEHRHTEAKSRRARHLRSQLLGAGSATAVDLSRRQRSTESGAKGMSGVAARGRDAPIPAPEILRELEAEDDPRIDSQLDISAEQQRRLLWLRDRLDSLTHFEVLGIRPSMESRVIRKAYHQTSRELHPDRFYGKEMGLFGPLTVELFKRAKASYELLMDDRGRAAYVERLLGEERRKNANVEASRQRAEIESRRRRDLEAAVQAKQDAEAERLAVREADKKREERSARDAVRRGRVRERLLGGDRRSDKARMHFRDGMIELKAGREGAAAGLFRLALDIDESNIEYHQRWHECLAIARQKSASKAFTMGLRCQEIGKTAESAHFFCEAADASPSTQNLAEAAGSIAESDPTRARAYALSALDAMEIEARSGGGLAGSAAGRVHLCCARAFWAAGQGHSAKAQLEAVLHLLPGDPEATTLLKSIKVT